MVNNAYNIVECNLDFNLCIFGTTENGFLFKFISMKLADFLLSLSFNHTMVEQVQNNTVTHFKCFVVYILKT